MCVGGIVDVGMVGDKMGGGGMVGGISGGNGSGTGGGYRGRQRFFN